MNMRNRNNLMKGYQVSVQAKNLLAVALLGSLLVSPALAGPNTYEAIQVYGGDFEIYLSDGPGSPSYVALYLYGNGFNYCDGSVNAKGGAIDHATPQSATADLTGILGQLSCSDGPPPSSLDGRLRSQRPVQGTRRWFADVHLQRRCRALSIPRHHDHSLGRLHGDLGGTVSQESGFIDQGVIKDKQKTP